MESGRQLAAWCSIGGCTRFVLLGLDCRRQPAKTAVAPKKLYVGKVDSQVPTLMIVIFAAHDRSCATLEIPATSWQSVESQQAQNECHAYTEPKHLPSSQNIWKQSRRLQLQMSTSKQHDLCLREDVLRRVSSPL